MTFTISTTAFNAGLRKVADLTSKTGAEVVNTKAYAVTAGAANDTVVADKNRIAKELGQIGTKIVVDRKTGLRKAGRRIYRLDKAAILVNWRLKQQGKAPLGGEELARAARRFIGAKIGGVGFIASGWIKAARDLARFAKGVRFSLPRGIKVIGVKGKGSPARGFIGEIVARIENDALIQSGGRFQTPGKTFSPNKVAEEGLRKAMDRESANMADYLSGRLNQEWRKVGAA